MNRLAINIVEDEEDRCIIFFDGLVKEHLVWAVVVVTFQLALQVLRFIRTFDFSEY